MIERVLNALDTLTQRLEMGEDLRPEVFEDALEPLRQTIKGASLRILKSLSVKR